MKIPDGESKALIYVRVCSMLAIILCHICQTYSRTNHWAYIFNIGVQAFIALSGYLYGHKFISDWKQWGMGRLKRIYLPMALFLILVLPCYLIFQRDVFNWKAYALNFVNLQGIAFVTGGGMIQGVRHLWFLTAIMFAYLATPILQKLIKFADILLPALLLCVGLGYCLLTGWIMFFASWIYIYAISYWYCHIKNTKIYDVGLLILSIMLIVAVCYLGWGTITSYFNPLNRCFHDVLGVFIVIWGVKLLKLIDFKKIPYIVEVFDRYSFQIFIVHYFFVIGPFSLARTTPYVGINICLMLLATVVATMIFSWLNNIIAKWLFVKKME